MTPPLSHPPRRTSKIRRVAILFSGGPAPAANAVISTAAVSFLRNGIEVLGIRYGYSGLVQYGPDHPMEDNRDYIRIGHKILKRTRNSQGVLIGTSRENPGKDVTDPAHFSDPKRTAPLRAVYDALISLEVDALVSIGGDDTLKTANKLRLFQDRLPGGSRRIAIVHLPKTIDNDYQGIDFTFGYFTAVETLGTEIRNLLADAESSRSYFVAETMGRSAGWLAYGAAIAGEASFVISVEDIRGKYEVWEDVPGAAAGEEKKRRTMDVAAVIRRIVEVIRVREEKEGKPSGVIVLAEGLAELLPYDVIQTAPRDEHGHLKVAKLSIGRLFADLIAEEYARQTGRKKKIVGLQLGYESRCSRPQAFDVMLGSQLGVGAYRALVEEERDGVMVSVTGQLRLIYEPFENLVDPWTLVTVVRYIEPDSDFHRLARFLETYIND